LCGKKFLYSYNVVAHVKYVHNREKRIYDDSKTTCHLCGKKFQKIWKVKEHLAEVHKIIEAPDEEEIIVDQVILG
jgi:5-methylcytosine-specific restriction endonuclease McrA